MTSSSTTTIIVLNKSVGIQKEIQSNTKCKDMDKSK